MENYFELCPLEITEHIFSYLETSEIINLSKTCQQFENVCLSKALNSCDLMQFIFSTTDLHRKYQISGQEFCQFVSVQPRCEIITSLNINCMYWIYADELRKCLSKMKSLQSLYAVDTKLSLLKSDYLLYKKLTSLKKLAVSVSKNRFNNENVLHYFPKVTHLYLHIDFSGRCIIEDVMSTIAELKTVKELWLVESGLTDAAAPLVFLHPPQNLNKFTYLVNRISFAFREGAYKNRWFKSMSNGQQACWELDIHRGQLETKGNKHWDYLLYFFRDDGPFSLKQTKELLFEKETLETILFDELNFSHDFASMCKGCRDSISAVLLYPNVRMLRKLSVNYCACFVSDDYLCSIKAIKRRKLEDAPASLLQKIVENSPHIEELELWSCRRPGCVTEKSINSIAGLASLKKLTLDDVPPEMNPSFLINICTLCKHLTSLRVKSKQLNSRLHGALCLALQKTVTLKDLRYEHPCSISIDRLFDALMQNKRLKLERLFVKCKTVEIFSAKPFLSYLRCNDELKFLYVVIKDLPKIAITRILDSMNSSVTRKREPQRVVVVTQDELDTRVYVPNFHIFEMVRFATNVSVLDVFNGFTKQ